MPTKLVRVNWGIDAWFSTEITFGEVAGWPMVKYRGNKAHSGAKEAQVLPPDGMARRTILATSIVAALATAGIDPASASTPESLVGATTDASTAAFLTDPNSLSRAALSAAMASKIDRAETDNGATVLGPMRNPTLTTKRAFPNARSSYRPVYGDGNTVYAVGRDMCMRKSVDGGMNWSGRFKTLNQQAYRDCFLKLSSGTILTLHNTAPLTIWRSTDDAANFMQVHGLAPGMILLGPQSWCQDPNTGYVYYVEYASPGGPNMRVWRSTNDGTSFMIFYTFPGQSQSTNHARVKHLHSAIYDPVSRRVCIMAGDTEPGAGIYRVTADGASVEPIIINPQMPDPDGQACAIGMMSFPDHIAWGSDRPGNGQLWRLPRDEIGKPTPVAESIYRLNGEAWWTVKARDDSSLWMMSTGNETSEGHIGPRDKILDASVHLYAIWGGGAKVADMGTVGSTRLYSGVTPIGPGGTDFWIGTRGFNNDGAYRAEIARGGQTLPLPQTSGAPALYEYLSTVNSGNVTVQAGGEMVFAHARVPKILRTLFVKDVGVLKLSGSGGLRIKARVQGTGALAANIDSGAVGALANSQSEASDFYTAQIMAADTTIEFVIYESTGKAAATGCAYATYGWGKGISDHGLWD
ncbi:hypothetical protein ACIPUB_17385 [Paeniglutamicibacter sp. ORCA_105]|uniref:hypothetical protein n=1 Tax=Paeniglutamicibacter sp. ORCA_105 TaxID=3377336 RepID=UPI00389455D0